MWFSAKILTRGRYHASSLKNNTYFCLFNFSTRSRRRLLFPGLALKLNSVGRWPVHCTRETPSQYPSRRNRGVNAGRRRPAETIAGQVAQPRSTSARGSSREQFLGVMKRPVAVGRESGELAIRASQWVPYELPSTPSTSSNKIEIEDVHCQRRVFFEEQRLGQQIAAGKVWCDRRRDRLIAPPHPASSKESPHAKSCQCPSAVVLAQRRPPA